MVTKAIEAGIWNDLGSGSNVDVTIITSNGAEILRNLKLAAQRVGPPKADYKYSRGSTGTTFI